MKKENVTILKSKKLIMQQVMNFIMYEPIGARDLPYPVNGILYPQDLLTQNDGTSINATCTAS